MNRNIHENILLAALLTFIFVAPHVQAQTVLQELKNHKETQNFAIALENSTIAEQLNQDGPFTLFAPANKKFEQLTIGQKSDDNLLLNHIFTGMATERSLKAMSEITCLSGQKITVKENGNRVLVNSMKILESNIRADNGVIHIIDGVIK